MKGLIMHSEAMPLGDGLSVTFTYTGGTIDTYWDPALPRGREGKKYLPAYRLARNEFLRRVALKIGGNVAVVQV